MKFCMLIAHWMGKVHLIKWIKLQFTIHTNILLRHWKRSSWILFRTDSTVYTDLGKHVEIVICKIMVIYGTCLINEKTAKCNTLNRLCWYFIPNKRINPIQLYSAAVSSERKAWLLIEYHLRETFLIKLIAMFKSHSSSRHFLSVQQIPTTFLRATVENGALFSCTYGQKKRKETKLKHNNFKALKEIY